MFLILSSHPIARPSGPLTSLLLTRYRFTLKCEASSQPESLGHVNI